MRIVICGSLAFTYEIEHIQHELERLGFEVLIPLTSRRILAGEMTLEGVENSKGGSEAPQLKISDDIIRYYYDEIQKADAVLVANYQKKGIDGYIGGNTLIEMSFAHIFRKPLFLVNPIPNLPYRDEIQAMQPIILGGQIEAVAQHLEVRA